MFRKVEIGRNSSNSDRDNCIHFRTNIIGNGMTKNLLRSRTIGLTVEITGISSLGLHKSRERTNLNSKLT